MKKFLKVYGPGFGSDPDGNNNVEQAVEADFCREKGYTYDDIEDIKRLRICGSLRINCITHEQIVVRVA